MRPSRALPAAALVIVVLAAVAVIASRREGGPGPGEAQVTVSGTARVTRSSGRTLVVRDAVFLHSGDALTLLSGTADFDLVDAVHYQAAHRQGARDPKVVMGAIPELAAGDLLVTTAGNTKRTTTVMSGGTAVTVPVWSFGGAVRLSRTYAVTVGVYRGVARVDSAGASSEVQELRRIEVPALGRINRNLRPLEVDSGDRWDRRFLGPAISIDRQLVPVLSGWVRSGGGGWTAAQLRAALPGQPEEAELAALVNLDRGGGETMVGAAVTGLGTRGSYGVRWKQVFAFHDAGATWGLVAMDQAVSPSALLGAVSAPIDGTPFPYPETALTLLTPTGVLAVPAALAAGTPLPAGSTIAGTVAPNGSVPTGAPGGTAVAPTATGGAAPAGGSIPSPAAGGSGTSAGGGLPGSIQSPLGGILGGGGSVSGGGLLGGAPVPSPALPPISTPPVTTPPLTTPPLTTPPLTTPPLTTPTVTVPSLPTPQVTLPQLSTPPVSLPPLTVPSVTVPSVTVPSVTVPSVNVPFVP